MHPNVPRSNDEVAVINTFRSIILASALASAGIAASGMAADARTSYDGSWSVLIITG